MEKSITETDRVLVICTDSYIQKANAGTGGVGYEKTIATAEILKDHKRSRKFVPIVRNVTCNDKLPTFFGAALYLDLSDGKDNRAVRTQLLKSLHEVPVSKPQLGASPFLPAAKPQGWERDAKQEQERPSLRGQDRIVVFDERFSQAFPGVRGVAWFDDSAVIAERLGILLQQPLEFKEGNLVGWWRGPANLHIGRFEHIEGPHFLMDVEEVNISRIAAVNQGAYYRKFVYVEMAADEPTGLYPCGPDHIASRVEEFGFANEEYGLVDDKLPVTRAEYDDGAAIIEGRPVDIRGRAYLRARYVSPYNFLIAPFMSPINNKDFDYVLQSYLNRLLQGEDVFDQMRSDILRLPKRE